MPEQLWFTAILNRYFGALANALLHAVGIQPVYPSTPINNTVAMEILVFLFLIVFFALVRLTLSVDRPNPLQHLVEILEDFMSGQAHEIIGHDYQRYVPFVMALGFFILTSNLLGLIPGFESPTQNAVVPLGCALSTFFYYHFHGIRQHGAGYIKQFLGPTWALAPLMFVIEVVSHLARILSLTVRLFANMYAGELVTMAFFSLVPIAVPVLFMSLHLGVALIQTFIFVILTVVYLGMAVSEEH
jgi:F-type H+-transporting ATPase subunit a